MVGSMVQTIILYTLYAVMGKGRDILEDEERCSVFNTQVSSSKSPGFEQGNSCI